MFQRGKILVSGIFRKPIYFLQEEKELSGKLTEIKNFEKEFWAFWLWSSR